MFKADGTYQRHPISNRTSNMVLSCGECKTTGKPWDGRHSTVETQIHKGPGGDYCVECLPTAIDWHNGRPDAMLEADKG